MGPRCRNFLMLLSNQLSIFLHLLSLHSSREYRLKLIHRAVRLSRAPCIICNFFLNLLSLLRTLHSSRLWSDLEKATRTRSTQRGREGCEWRWNKCALVVLSSMRESRLLSCLFICEDRTCESTWLRILWRHNRQLPDCSIPRNGLPVCLCSADRHISVVGNELPICSVGNSP